MTAIHSAQKICGDAFEFGKTQLSNGINYLKSVDLSPGAKKTAEIWKEAKKLFFVFAAFMQTSLGRATGFAALAIACVYITTNMQPASGANVRNVNSSNEKPYRYLGLVILSHAAIAAATVYAIKAGYLKI